MVPDDGSVEQKRYSIDFSINLSFHLDYIVINFSLYIYIYREREREIDNKVITCNDDVLFLSYSHLYIQK